MGNKIVVTPQKLKDASSKVTDNADEYFKTYTQLFNEVDAMGANWSGTDNVAFVNQIKGFQDDFKKMYDLMKQYADFLQQSAIQYETTQSNIAEAAKKLTN